VKKEVYSRFFNLVDVEQYKSVICLNGELPAKSFFDCLTLPIIATDAAANYLYDNGIGFEIVTGDMDGVRQSVLSSSKRNVTLPDQNLSDFQKTLEFSFDNGLLPAIVLGVSGGYIDHIINNLDSFCRTDDNVFLAGEIAGFKLSSSRGLKLEIGTKISIIGFPRCKISTSGLKWELRDRDLCYPGYNSFFNRVAAEDVEINILSGCAVVMIYLQDVMDYGLL
jgi:thiamine pyrophosphokinase